MNADILYKMKREYTRYSIGKKFKHSMPPLVYYTIPKIKYSLINLILVRIYCVNRVLRSIAIVVIENLEIGE